MLKLAPASHRLPLNFAEPKLQPVSSHFAMGTHHHPPTIAGAYAQAKLISQIRHGRQSFLPMPRTFSGDNISPGDTKVNCSHHSVKTYLYWEYYPCGVMHHSTMFCLFLVQWTQETSSWSLHELLSWCYMKSFNHVLFVFMFNENKKNPLGHIVE